MEQVYGHMVEMYSMMMIVPVHTTVREKAV